MGWFGGRSRAADAPPVRIDLIPVDQIFQNPYQPRRTFHPAQLDQLKRSIREYGVLVPILVRRLERGYELACGERRLRACRELGLRNIPAIVRELSTPQMLELALCENLARAGLTPLEEAETYERLRKEFVHLTEEQLNEKLGLPPEAASRYRRILTLPLVVKRALTADLIDLEQSLLLGAIPDEPRCLRYLTQTLERHWDARQLAAALAADGPAA